MFTGIIQAQGTIAALDRHGDWTVTIATPPMLDNLAPGASVACSGICMTVINLKTQQFTARISGETLSKTTAAQWQVGTHLNLERALRVGDELGGHLVAGHVDGIAHLTGRQPEGDSLRLQFTVPPDFSRFLAPKGSIVLDGVSLTINEAEGAQFGVNIIPHTQQVTTLGACQPGDAVNFEVDAIARYVDRLLSQRAAP